MKKVNKPIKKKSKNKPHPFWRWFWLTFLVLSLTYAWHSFYTPSNDIKWISDITSTQELTRNTSKNTLIFFTGKWCSPCRIMKREVFADNEVEKIINSELIAIMIDIDSPNTKEIVKHYKVGATPTTIILDSNGKVLNSVIGKVGKKEFIEMISSIKSQ